MLTHCSFCFCPWSHYHISRIWCCKGWSIGNVWCKDFLIEWLLYYWAIFSILIHSLNFLSSVLSWLLVHIKQLRFSSQIPGNSCWVCTDDLLVEYCLGWEVASYFRRRVCSSFLDPYGLCSELVKCIFSCLVLSWLRSLFAAIIFVPYHLQLLQ